ncbi:diguanylate phosphodiesterase [Sulfuricella denitrificans skB26]|uniref:Diguanylate phosphodiesterase n=1 Tax=Sulfuricella denitrificans (strain DSM 22764 / NBRC 105220 / skB26) TaxID=1163617 RepID=S6B3S6_SULDS|nr:HDOD domain-containing protein [Sulfuricella denitrificans]BAN35287.1 diguanylate phosphodiesterase [Sulfuricella denitrificans skB26]
MKKNIKPAHAVLLELLEKVRNKEEIKEIELSFKRDVAASFKLLRYINSAGFSLSCEIQSIRHAVEILGYQQLYRWVTLLLVTASEGNTSPALIKKAVIRGRLAELLGKEMLGPADCDNLFIVGVFSLLDEILEVPMDQVLDTIRLPEPIVDALLHRQGLYGPFLALAEACEQGDEDEIENLACSLQLEVDKVSQDYLSAQAWAGMLGL